MRAVLCRHHGPPSSLRVEEVTDPVPGPGEALVRVEACGVNFPDTLIIENKYQQKPPLPFSPGGEVAGVVEALGPGVREPPVGSRVAALITFGGFAERVAVQADRLVPVPEGVAAPIAAATCLAYGTVLHALRDRAALRPGEWLLVLGAAGGVGLAAVQLGKLLGARVIAAASGEAKLALCREQGADAAVDYAAEGWRERVREITSGAGADVVLDPVGGAATEPALRSTAWGGRYLVVGFAAGDIPRPPLNLVLLKGCAVVGVFYGEYARREPVANRALLAQLFSWIAAGRLRPHLSATLPLERAAEALDALQSRRAIGKLVLLTQGPAPG